VILLRVRYKCNHVPWFIEHNGSNKRRQGPTYEARFAANLCELSGPFK